MSTANRVILAIVALGLSAWVINGEMKVQALRGGLDLKPRQCIYRETFESQSLGANMAVQQLLGSMSGHEMLYFRVRRAILPCDPLVR